MANSLRENEYEQSGTQARAYRIVLSCQMAHRALSYASGPQRPQQRHAYRAAIEELHALVEDDLRIRAEQVLSQISGPKWSPEEHLAITNDVIPNWVLNHFNRIVDLLPTATINPQADIIKQLLELAEPSW